MTDRLRIFPEGSRSPDFWYNNFMAWAYHQRFENESVFDCMARLTKQRGITFADNCFIFRDDGQALIFLLEFG